ncbi:PAS domain-containing protein [Flavisolibacter ginsenosidimutans]|uniref:PAS domain S-box protein n=1 Tax=Flavisolibacter ginsenosidimutans TaxID=661481 RepID=A0A5B8UL05_9BACT|nr:PAS domain-containing protein [Flavisolibacter ginsenosidimutans]QEC57381.1 PAS domain S-box protein [Flavisolibacter ginsenosidimutans]
MSDTRQFFDGIFNNAKVNAILVMDQNGHIKSVNDAFTSAYGYKTEDLLDQHFRILFTEKDQLIRKPEIELNITQREGSSTDENYLVHKNGTPIWVTGESVLVKTPESPCVVKIIHNIHAQKQLERYLLHTSELLEGLFESVQQSGLVILDAQMKVVKTNERFKQMFGITEPVAAGTKLRQVSHPFWNEKEIHDDLRNAIVNSTPIQKVYVVDNGNQTFRRLHIASKAIVGDDGSDKQILLMVKEE